MTNHLLINISITNTRNWIIFAPRSEWPTWNTPNGIKKKMNKWCQWFISRLNCKFHFSFPPSCDPTWSFSASTFLRWLFRKCTQNELWTTWEKYSKATRPWWPVALRATLETFPTQLRLTIRIRRAHVVQVEISIYCPESISGNSCFTAFEKSEVNCVENNVVLSYFLHLAFPLTFFFHSDGRATIFCL